jgi:naringenin degradation protein FdeH
MLKPIRRVVTGHTAQGRSVVLLDDVTTTHDLGPGRMTLYDLWSIPVVPDQIEGAASDPTDIPLDFEIPTSGVRVRCSDIPPGDGREPFMHRTESVDIVIIIDGEICMPMDDSEVVLRTGDVLVQRGTNHGWVNRSDRVCRVLFIIVAAKLSPDLMRSIGIDEVVWDPVHGGTNS